MRATKEEKVEFPAWRFKPRKWVPERNMTGIKDLDEVLRGLPVGLTVFLGPAGSGKSLMARHVAVSMAEEGDTVVYLICESMADNPGLLRHASPQARRRIHVGDYTRMLPRIEKALAEAKAAVKHFNADVLIIDSATRFFSGTRKAVEEADVRVGLWDISKWAENEGVSVIAISEVRGSGSWTAPAGGRAVEHAGTLLVYFDKMIVDKWDAKDYGFRLGEVVYTLRVDKDKHGLADTGKVYRVRYVGKKVLLRPLVQKE